jgi:hypothetical protein
MPGKQSLIGNTTLYLFWGSVRRSLSENCMSLPLSATADKHIVLDEILKTSMEDIL